MTSFMYRVYFTPKECFMYKGGGILYVEKDCLLVCFLKSSYYRNTYSTEVREECAKVFANHGFMEAVKLPYEIDSNGLTVVAFLPEEAQAAGWLTARDIYENDIPF